MFARIYKTKRKLDIQLTTFLYLSDVWTEAKPQKKSKKKARKDN